MLGWFKTKPAPLTPPIIAELRGLTADAEAVVKHREQLRQQQMADAIERLLDKAREEAMKGYDHVWLSQMNWLNFTNNEQELILRRLEGMGFVVGQEQYKVGIKHAWISWEK